MAPGQRRLTLLAGMPGDEPESMPWKYGLTDGIDTADLARRHGVGVHLHDTRGLAIANAVAALEHGARRLDASVGGLGGCPFASVDGKRAPGNISTEVLVHAIEDAGERTRVNRAKLAHAGAFAERIVTGARVRAATERAGGGS